MPYLRRGATPWGDTKDDRSGKIQELQNGGARSTLRFPATRRKLLNGASRRYTWAISIRDHSVSPLIRRNFKRGYLTQAFQFPNDPISQRRAADVCVHACARACNCPKRRGSSIRARSSTCSCDSWAGATSRLRRYHGESQRAGRLLGGFSSGASGEFGLNPYLAGNGREREKCHSSYAIYAHLFQGSIL